MTLPPVVKMILQRLQQAGYPTYGVGGCVRDALLGGRPHDWDICTAALPQQVHQVFSEFRVVDTGAAHGTVTLVVEGAPYEITTFRRDGAYSDHRRPEQVDFVPDLDQDLARRDFTINAMAVGLDGRVIDLYQGQTDLKRKIIRCVGRPEDRFQEDALRILRALRFAATLDFTLDPVTAKAVLDCKALLSCVSGERIYAEMNRLLVGPGAARILGQFTPVFGVILPEILPCVGFDQHNPAHYQDVWTHILTTISNSRPDKVIRWALLLHDLGKPKSFTLDESGIGHFKHHPEYSRDMAEEIFARLHADRNTRVRVCRLVLYHDAPPPVTGKDILRWQREFGLEDLHRLAEIRRCDGDAHTDAPVMIPIRQATRQFARELARISMAHDRGILPLDLRELNISGRDLAPLGIPEGARMGQLLEAALEAVVDGKCANRKAELVEFCRKLEEQS